MPPGDEMVQRACNQVRIKRRTAVLAEVGRPYQLVAPPADGNSQRPEIRGRDLETAHGVRQVIPQLSPATLTNRGAR